VAAGETVNLTGGTAGLSLFFLKSIFKAARRKPTRLEQMFDRLPHAARITPELFAKALGACRER